MHPRPAAKPAVPRPDPIVAVRPSPPLASIEPLGPPPVVMEPVQKAQPVQQPLRPKKIYRIVRKTPPVSPVKKKPKPRFNPIQPELLDDLPDEPLMPFK